MYRNLSLIPCSPSSSNMALVTPSTVGSKWHHIIDLSIELSCLQRWSVCHPEWTLDPWKHYFKRREREKGQEERREVREDKERKGNLQRLSRFFTCGTNMRKPTHENNESYRLRIGTPNRPNILEFLVLPQTKSMQKLFQSSVNSI